MHARRETTPFPARFDIWTIIVLLRRRLWIVVLTAFVLAGATAAYTLSVHPVYRANSRLLIDPSVRQPFDNPNLPTRSTGDDTYVDSQVAVIGSFAILRPVVRQFDLMSDAEFGDGGGSKGFLSSLLSMFRSSGNSAPRDEALRESNAVRALSKVMTARREGLTYVVDITVDSINPDKAAKLVDAIAHSYLEDRKTHQKDSSTAINDQIEQRLVGLRERLRNAELAVQRFKEENNLQSSGELGLLTSQELGGLNSQLTEARAALAEKQARYQEIASVLESGINPNSINVISDSPNIAQLRDQYSIAARAVANLEAELLPRHPRLVRARSEMKRIESLLRAQAEDAAGAAKVELGVARERVANLERALSTSRTAADASDTASIRLRELETEAETTHALYESALSRTKEISELDQIVDPGVRIISPGLSMPDPVWPKKKLLVGLGGILGLLIGTMLAVGAEIVRQAMQFLAPRMQYEDDDVATVTPVVATPAVEIPEERVAAAAASAYTQPEVVETVPAEAKRSGGSLLNVLYGLPEKRGPRPSGTEALRKG